MKLGPPSVLLVFTLLAVGSPIGLPGSCPAVRFPYGGRSAPNVSGLETETILRSCSRTLSGLC